MAEAPRLVNGSKLMDMGRGSAWSALSYGAHLRIGMCDLGAEASGKAAVAPRRCCRGIAGHHPRQSVIGERGKRLGVALSTSQPAGRRADPSPVDGTVAWRSLRSSQRPGKPVTGRREAAGLQQHGGEGGRR